MGGVDSDPGDPGTGGRNTIQGSIFLPGGRRMDRRVKIKLIGISGGEQFRMSDDSGAFSFKRLQGGRYTLVVDAGSEFQLVTEAVDIVDPAMRRRDSTGSITPVYITLQPRESETAKAGTVDASSAWVPEEARELYKQALESGKSGNHKQAIEQLQKALQLYATFPTALNELGVQYMALKQYDKAMDSFKAALKIAPDSFYPRLNYGITLVIKKDFKAAATELQQAVERKGSSGLARLELGRALINLGNYPAAEQSLVSCVRIGDSSSVEAHRYLGAVYIETRQSERAAEELETYLKLAPKARDADQIRAIIKDLKAQGKEKKF